LALQASEAGGLVASFEDQSLRGYDWAADDWRWAVEVPGRPALSLARCEDTGRLATGGMDNRVRLWEAAAGAPPSPCVGALVDEHTDYVSGLAFGPGGALLSAGLDGCVLLWVPR
jgi:WD40 repeat protein